MNRPGWSPNLSALYGQLFFFLLLLLLVLFIHCEATTDMSRSKLRPLFSAESNSPGLHKPQESFLHWEERKKENGRKKKHQQQKQALIFRFHCVLQCEQMCLPNRLTSLHSGRQSRLFAIDVKCHLKLVVLPRIHFLFFFFWAVTLLFPLLCHHMRSFKINRFRSKIYCCLCIIFHNKRSLKLALKYFIWSFACGFTKCLCDI